MSASFDEPTIPPRLRRPLAAAWISLGLHAALIALVQVVPPAVSMGTPVIEARLVPRHTPAPPETAPEPPETAPEPPAPLLPPESEPEALLPAEPVAVRPLPEPTPATVTPSAEPAPQAAPPTPASSAPAAPAAAITSSVDLTYYSARDLDQQPRALREIVPDYPEVADRRRISGRVRLQVQLEADGRVSDVTVVSAVPPELFEESAVRAFRDARFAPAQRNGRPVRARVLIEVEYDWEGRR